MSNQYNKGDIVRISTSTPFADSAGTAFDPATVTMRFQPPRAISPTSYTYPTDSEIVKVATGSYRLDVDTDIDHAYGTWRYDIKGKDGSGVSRGAHEGEFEVIKSKID